MTNHQRISYLIAKISLLKDVTRLVVIESIRPKRTHLAESCYQTLCNLEDVYKEILSSLEDKS